MAEALEPLVLKVTQRFLTNTKKYTAQKISLRADFLCLVFLLCYNARMKTLIIGNFKANPAHFKQAEELFKNAKKVGSKLKNVEVALAAPTIFLSGLQSYKSMFAAQDISIQNEGPHTGEVTGAMLRDIGVKYVIVGHSERRAAGETNEIVSTKIKNAWKAHLTPVVCVGEMERDQLGKFWNALREQIEGTFAGAQKSWLKDIVVAYEPVWALSTTANRHDVTSAEVHEATIFIRKVLADMFGQKESMSVRIIYGGSVNSKNAEDILKNGNVTGLLPGKASLNAKEFAKILTIANVK